MLGIGLLIAVLTLSTILWKFQKDHAQTIFPGVSVAGIDLSDLTLGGQAVVEINSKLTYGRTGQIQFHSEENRWVYTPEELGFPTIRLTRRIRLLRSAGTRAFC